MGEMASGTWRSVDDGWRCRPWLVCKLAQHEQVPQLEIARRDVGRRSDTLDESRDQLGGQHRQETTLERGAAVMRSLHIDGEDIHQGPHGFEGGETVGSGREAQPHQRRIAIAACVIVIRHARAPPPEARPSGSRNESTHGR